jgi:hypothetical protein
MRCGLCGEKGESMDREYVKDVSVLWAHRAGKDICHPCFFVMNHARHLPNDENMLAMFAEVMRPSLSRIRKLGKLLQAKRETLRQERTTSPSADTAATPASGKNKAAVAAESGSNDQGGTTVDSEEEDEEEDEE